MVGNIIDKGLLRLSNSQDCSSHIISGSGEIIMSDTSCQTKICNFWYWLYTSTGEKFKQCSSLSGCPRLFNTTIICGLHCDSSSTSVKEETK